jgi:hypothetical protein
MVWKILRPRFWILDRKVRETNRFIIFGLIALLAFGGQWVYDSFIRNYLDLLSAEQALPTAVSLLPLGLSLFLLFAVLGIGDVINQLFLTPDLEVLLVAPIPSWAIYTVKLLQCSRATLLPAVFLGVFLLVLGLAWQVAATYYLFIAIILLAVVALTTAIIMILVIILARFIPSQRLRSWMPVAVILATMALFLGQQVLGQWLTGQQALNQFLSHTLQDPGRLSIVAVALAGLSLVVSLAAFLIFDRAFHEDWDRFREVPSQPPSATPYAPRALDLTRLARPLRAPLRHLVVKEWLQLRRDPTGLIRLAQPFALVIFMLFPLLAMGQEGEFLRIFSFWYLLVVLPFFMGILSAGTSLLAVAGEGRNIALLRSAPLSIPNVLWGKFGVAWGPAVLVWSIVLLLVGFWLGLLPGQQGLLISLVVWVLTGASLAALAMGGLTVDFMAEDLKQRISTPVNYLTMGLGLLLAALTTVAGIWLVVHLFPDSDAVRVLQPFASDRAVSWVFSNAPWPPLILLCGQAAYFVGVKWLWDSAVRRLEEWEPG